MNIKVLAPFILLLLLSFCKKVEDTIPRYDKDACLTCSHYTEKGAGKCFHCKTTGVCTFCKGSGKRLVGKKDNFIEEACPFCKGSGKCHYCEGSGNCNVCKGSGKYHAVKPEEKKSGE